MAYNVLSGTVVGPDRLIAQEDGTMTQVTASVSGTYINASGTAVSFGTIGAIGDSGKIGASEDGSYTDGLFQDFTTNTLIGIPVDRYNELFKSLVPPPAPNISRLDAAQDGTDAKLSFGASNDMSSDSPTYHSVGTTAGFSAVDKGGLYETATAGNNFRRSIFRLNTDITGSINFDTAASVLGSYTNHEADAFGSGETGSLQLFVNSTSTAAHTLNLTTAPGAGAPGAGNSSSLNADGTGFTNVSVTASATDANNNTFDIFKHRTAKYIVDTDSQRNGWNYAFIKHTVGSANYTTNYIEWVNDANSTTHTITNNAITNISLAGQNYVSGVKYNTGATANYQFLITHFYKNVYTTATVTCSDNTGRSTIANASMPEIGGDDENKLVSLTQSINVTANILLNQGIQATSSLTHVFKGTATGTTAAAGFLILNPTANNPTETVEYFKNELWRMPSGAFASQSDAVTGSWLSGSHMTGSGTQADGLQIYDQKLVSPLNTTNGGNFSAISNTESGNPNYSGVSGTRTFYRAFKNAGSAVENASITIAGAGTIILSGGTLGANDNLKVFVKTPGKTGWMSMADAFTFNNVSDGNGARDPGVTLQTALGGSPTNVITLGNKSIATNEYLIVKIEADAAWTGNVSRITVVFGAGSGGITNPSNLSRIDETMSNNGSTAKLSFGGDKAITGYTSVAASPNINGALNTNALWQPNTGITNQRLGIYNKTLDVTGKLNSTITSARITNGDTGNLKLYINGAERHSIDFGSYGTGNTLNTSGSGFQGVTNVLYPQHGNSVHDYTKPYRTGSFIVDTNDQRNGWNYAQVIHTGSFGERATSYIEWVNDSDASTISIAGGAIANFNATSYYYSSGVKFFATAPSASFTLTSSNNYKNVYDDDSADAIDFNNSLTNVTISALTASGTGISTTTDANGVLAYPALTTSADSQNTAVNYSLTLNFTPSVSLMGAFVSGASKHTASLAQVTFLEPPFNSNNNTATTFNSGDFSSFAKSGFLRMSGTDDSSTSSETFNGEAYRLENNNVNYTTQANITGGTYDWNPQNSVNDNGSHANYSDGLVVFDGKLVSPTKVGNAGDCRNIADGGSLQSPVGNVNYSIAGLTTGMRTYVRSYRNTSGGSKSNATVTIYGSGSMEDMSDALNGGGKFSIEVKFPTSDSSVNTAWLDAGSPYTSNNRGVDGAGAFVGDAEDLPLAIAGGGTSFSVTFNGGSWVNNQYLLLRVRASASWDGYIDRIDIG